MAWNNHEYTRRFPQMGYRPHRLGETERGVSTMGLTACRERGQEDPAAILSAIRAGVNVLDTAPHYHQGAHERAVGEAVRMADGDGTCPREALLVNTTIGPIPELITNNIRTHGFGRLKAFIEERFIVPGMFQWRDLVASRLTIAPGFIRHSVEQTLARTGLDHVDYVLLDSLDVHQRYLSPTEFERRVRAAFGELQDLCARGLVRGYGISTTVPLDLPALLELATTTPNPRPTALRAPFSMLHQDLQPLLEQAARAGLHVFASGCLDGGTPQYQLPDQLAAHVGDHPDSTAAIRWVQSAPWVDTALFASRDRRHIRANLAAAALDPLDPDLYRTTSGASS